MRSKPPRTATRDQARGTRDPLLAIRHAAALIDVTPLFKYLITDPDATRLVDRVITRDVTKMALGQVYYTPWCDERGKVIDDGTVSRLDERTYRWTAADPNLRWFHQNAHGLEVAIRDITEEVAALALQGPTSAQILRRIADADINSQDGDAAELRAGDCGLEC